MSSTTQEELEKFQAVGRIVAGAPAGKRAKFAAA
jgi:hypothetical protein